MTHRRDHLEALLAAHRPVDPRELGFVERMTALLRSDGDPFGREHYVPGHFTASSFVLSPQRDALLLIFHGKLHRWLQPGGHVDPTDRDIIDAARREVAEEVGISALGAPVDGAIFDVDIHDIPPLKGHPGHAHFDVRFLFVAPDRNFQAGSDAAAARWVALSDIGAVESDESVMRAVSKLRG